MDIRPTHTLTITLQAHDTGAKASTSQEVTITLGTDGLWEVDDGLNVGFGTTLGRALGDYLEMLARRGR